MTTDIKSRQTRGHTMQLATEERKNQFIDLLGSMLSERQVPALEGWMAFLRGGLGMGVLVLSSRIIATPPPFVQGFALILPAPAWAIALLFTAALSYIGRTNIDLCTRRNGSVGGYAVMCALLGPLWIKAPGLCLMMALLSLPHVVVALRLHRKCKEEGKPVGGAS
jgi:hypothetical protein